MTIAANGAVVLDIVTGVLKHRKVNHFPSTNVASIAAFISIVLIVYIFTMASLEQRCPLGMYEHVKHGHFCHYSRYKTIP